MSEIARPRGWSLAALAVALLAVAARVYVWRATHCTIEDAYITLRYAENIAAGNGFVYNPGERVLGTTTPLFTLLLALAAALHLDPLAAGKVLCIAADAGICLLLAQLCAELGHRRAGLAAALLYATASAPINFSIGGMETSLVALAGLCAVIGLVRCRPLPMCVSLALLILLRVDGALLALVLLPAYALHRRIDMRRDGKAVRLFGPGGAIPSRALLVGGLILLPWLVFACAYFGSPIPTSALAKLTVYSRLRRGLFPNLDIVMHQFVGDKLHAALFVVALIGAEHAWRHHPRLRGPLVWLVLYHAVITVSSAPVIAFGWYFVPPLPVYYLACGLGFAVPGRWLLVRQGDTGTVGQRENPKVSPCPPVPLSPWLATAFLVLLAAGLTFNLRSVARSIAAPQRVEDTLRRPLGEWLAANSPPDATVMAESIGYIGYFSHRRILDLVGLVSPQVIPFYRSGDPNPLGAIVNRFHPDYLVLRESERDEIEAWSRAHGRPLIDTDYGFVARFPNREEPPFFLLYRRYPSAARK